MTQSFGSSHVAKYKTDKSVFEVRKNIFSYFFPLCFTFKKEDQLSISNMTEIIKRIGWHLQCMRQDNEEMDKTFRRRSR
jgi:hypothetical protein